MMKRTQGFSTYSRAVAVSSLLALEACAGPDESTDLLAEKNESIDVLYDKAMETFQRKSYKAATEEFE